MKITPEKTYRSQVLNMASSLNCRFEVERMFERYDRLLKRCTNEKERKEIAIMGIAELHKFFHCYGNLLVNGVEIIPARYPEDDDGKI